MSERQSISVVYRGKSYSGQWWIESGLLYVASDIGSKSGPAAVPGRLVSLPSSIAKGMLWELARANDPHRPFFSWR